jgi:branched-chain amino acid transport system permease protein
VQQFLQVVIAGATNGAVYGLAALSVVLVFRVSKVVSLVQGEFISLGALGSYWLTDRWGWHRGVAGIASVALVGALGLLAARYAVIPAKARGGRLLTLILVTLALSVIGQGVGFLAFGSDLYSAPPFVGSGPFVIGGAVLASQVIVLMAVTFVLALAMAAVFQFTAIGKALIACAENPVGAAAVGIGVQPLTVAVFGVAALLGAISGIVLMPITVFGYTTGFGIAMRGLVAAALVGLESPLRALGAGVLVGLLESFVGGYWSSSYQTIVVFGVLVAALLAVPRLIPDGEVT